MVLCKYKMFSKLTSYGICMYFSTLLIIFFNDSLYTYATKLKIKFFILIILICENLHDKLSYFIPKKCTGIHKKLV